MKQAIHVTLSFFYIWAIMLHAEVRIEITQGVNEARPIGVIPYKWNSITDSVPEDISNIIATDLRHSGRFNPLDRSRLPQHPNNVTEVQPDLWKTLGINSIVIGQVQSGDDDSYTVTYQLIDISSSPCTILVQNQYKVTKQWLRYAAHSASDEIFEKLTGIKGAFRTKIAYIAHMNNSEYPYELRISDYDGYNQFIVHRSLHHLMSPAWSPDGNKLAYVTFESGKSALVIQTLTDGVIRQVASFQGHNGAPAFSLDGSKLAFALSKTGSLNIYVMDLNSGQIRQVTEGRFNNTEPTWYPDSQNIAYTSDQSGRPQIYKININGGKPQRITWEGIQNQDADISFDGKFMVMISTNNGTQHLVRQDLQTGNIQQLTDTFLDETPSLSPNGIMVIYSSTQVAGSVLQLVSADGRFKARLPNTDGQIKFPAWSLYL